jgi:hypothetical protein
LPIESGDKNSGEPGTEDASAGSSEVAGGKFANAPSRPPVPAIGKAPADAITAGSLAMAPRMPFATAAHGALAVACAASILPTPPSRPPVAVSETLSAGGADAVSGNRPSESGKIGGCQASAPTRLAGMSDQ